MKRYLIFLFSCFTLITATGQQVNLDKFLTETQISNSDPNSMSLVWWIPIEFWKITLTQDGSMSEEQIDEFLSKLKPYVIFAVVDGEIGPFGGVTYTSFESITNTIQLVDRENTSYKPLKTTDLDPDVQNLLAMIKPMMQNMMGQLGENMNFFVFDDFKKKEQFRIADPYAIGSVQIKFTDQKYMWRTPIGALLPEKICPIDGELLDGSWKYCPHHGEPLIDQE